MKSVLLLDFRSSGDDVYVGFSFGRSFISGGNERRQYITELKLSSIMFTKDISIKET